MKFFLRLRKIFTVPLPHGPYPQYGWDFPEEIPENFRKDPGNALRAFPGIRLGCPKPYNSRHLKPPEHFQNSLPPSTAGGASFFRSGSGEGLSEPVMEFPAILGAFLTPGHPVTPQPQGSSFHTEGGGKENLKAFAFPMNELRKKTLFQLVCLISVEAVVWVVSCSLLA